MMELSCDVICDLIYVYSLGCCCEETEQIVEEHAAHCKSCAEQLEFYWEEGAYTEDFKPLTELIPEFFRKRGKFLLKLLAITLFLYLLTVTAMKAETWLTRYACISVADSDYRIVETCQFRDGEIACRYQARYASTFSRGYIVTENKEIYFPARRPILDEVHERMDVTVGWILDPRQVWDHERRTYTSVRAIYMGNPGSAALIWEEGMTLPAVPQVIQENFDRYKNRGSDTGRGDDAHEDSKTEADT